MVEVPMTGETDKLLSYPSLCYDPGPNIAIAGALKSGLVRNGLKEGSTISRTASLTIDRGSTELP